MNNKRGFKFYFNAFRNTKTSQWFSIPIPLGIGVIAYMQYRHISQRPHASNYSNIPQDIQITGPWYIHLYSMLPLRTLSRLWGELHSLDLPTFARIPIYKTYSWLFNCDLQQIEQGNLKEFRNLGEFFYRSLKPNARVIDDALLTSPSDGKLLHYGKVPSGVGYVEQVKNVTYSVNALLGDKSDRLASDSKMFLHYAVIYLAPGDYHRFHSPCDWKIHEARHFAGEMFSVSPWMVSQLKNLFVLNERIVLLGEWKYGFFSMIPVAATNVGNIHLNFENKFKTNAIDDDVETHSIGVFRGVKYAPEYEFKPGEEMGGFKLGSTVVLVFEAPESFEFTVEKGIKRRILSGIQPTGIPHIGNYLGALSQWVHLQSQHSNCMYSIADLHALTVKQDPIELKENVSRLAISLLAIGINPKDSIIFRQSMIHQHTELAWILMCSTPFNWLKRMHHWKSKIHDGQDIDSEGLNIGLLSYPILQTADILLYEATDVPVGQDQMQHLNLAIDIAKSFNSNQKRIFTIPKAKLVSNCGMKVMSLKSPMNKMSKSDNVSSSRILLTDSDDDIVSKIRKSTTDSISGISYDPINRPGITNLLNIMASFTDQDPMELSKIYAHASNLSFKNSVSDVIISKIRPIRMEIKRLEKDLPFVMNVLEQGEERASHIAQETIRKVKHAIGLYC